MKDINLVHDYNLSVESREIFLFPEDEIDNEVAANFIKNMRILSFKKDPIIIHLNSVGGDRVAGMSMYDYIIGAGCPTIIICSGICASAASIILQAATPGYRVITPNCEMGIHEGSVTLESNPKAAISQIEANNRIVNNMYDIYANACKNGEYFKDDKIPKIKSYLKRKLSVKEDWYLDPAESVYYGFADSILGNKDYETIEKIRGYL
jgi:ATP-dependent protease ClpP protease subunit